ncbi:MAG: hypothetical protein U0992_06600 [Planctomycetaceae bacterium]
MPTRRSILKRLAVGVAGTVLLLVSYIAGGPMVVFLVLPRYPATMPVLQVVYGPLDHYCTQPGLPGADRYRDYVEWCRSQLMPSPPVLPTLPGARPVPRSRPAPAGQP